MRCPKCGYNSFDHLDSCKKCGKDLIEHKQRFGIVSVLFPGQVASIDTAEPESDESIVDEVVAAAAPAAAQSVAEERATSEDGDVAEPSSENDDFGFDFMGDSEEEEDLSFDELFEEAPADEDVEETLPSPEKEEAASGDDFSFDTDPDSIGVGADEGLEEDFGFDPDGDIEKPAEDDLAIEPDTVNFDDEEQDSGAAEDPKGPFDLPEPPQDEEAPESDSHNLFAADSDIEKDDLLATGVSAEDAIIASSLAEKHWPDKTTGEGDFLQQRAVAELPKQDGAAEPRAEELVATPGAVEESDREHLPVVEEVDSTDRQGTDALLPATGSRVAAFICDLFLLFLVASSFLLAAEAAISPAGGFSPTLESLLALSIPYFLVLFSLAFGYFTLFHFLAGQTPGKMLAGLRVESADGEPLLLSQAFLRSVGGLLQLLPVGLGYLAILTSAERRGWNDRLAGTRLISLKAVVEEG